jgi:hypothetical protein
MKKILAALLVASFGAGLMAQDLVYDYKASIKRLDAQFSIKKDKKNNKFVASSYKVASDTISGYVVLPICVSCHEQGVEATWSDEFEGTAYLVRKGDKLSKKAGVPYVLVTPVSSNAAIFGAYVNIKDATGAPQANIKAANKAWMWLNYSLPEDSVAISTKYVLKNVAEDQITLGYLGLTNVGIQEDTLVQHTGFGAAKITGWYEAAELGWCEDGESSEGSCQYVSSISGTLVGYPTYLGMCGVTPMWDVCYDKTNNNIMVTDGVVSGSWTLKYNKSVTKGYNAEGPAFLFKKLKANYDADMIDENYNGAAEEEEEEGDI